jgi:hypothetical protein
MKYDRKEFISRIGTYLMLWGIGAMVMFALSEAAGETNFNYFCGGMTLLFVAYAFRRQYKKPAGPPSGRGTGFRKWIKDPFAPLRNINLRRGRKSSGPPPADDFFDEGFDE